MTASMTRYKVTKEMFGREVLPHRKCAKIPNQTSVPYKGLLFVHHRLTALSADTKYGERPGSMTHCRH